MGRMIVASNPLSKFFQCYQKGADSLASPLRIRDAGTASITARWQARDGVSRLE